MDKIRISKMMLAIGLGIMLSGLGAEALAQKAPGRRHAKVVRVLPAGHKAIVVGGSKYHYHNGVYYRRGSSGYVVAPAPVGATLVKLSPGFTMVVVAGTPYFYSHGAFYRQNPRRNAYVVVAAPVGAIVPALPATHQIAYVRGHKHYLAYGVYYQPIRRSGVVVYRVVRVG